MAGAELLCKVRDVDWLEQNHILGWLIGVAAVSYDKSLFEGGLRMEPPSDVGHSGSSTSSSPKNTYLMLLLFGWAISIQQVEESDASISHHGSCFLYGYLVSWICKNEKHVFDFLGSRQKKQHFLIFLTITPAREMERGVRSIAKHHRSPQLGEPEDCWTAIALMEAAKGKDLSSTADRAHGWTKCCLNQPETLSIHHGSHGTETDGTKACMVSTSGLQVAVAGKMPAFFQKLLR